METTAQQNPATHGVVATEPEQDARIGKLVQYRSGTVGRVVKVMKFPESDEDSLMMQSVELFQGPVSCFRFLE